MEKINISQKYNLPKEVKFCKKCVISNQRPRIVFDKDGICSACRYFEYKETIDFNQREEELKKLLDKHRSNNERYDCVVPSSGGKDSAYVAHELKSKYGMNPLTVTWSPLKYTDIGWQNLNNFNDSGFDVILGMPQGDVKKKLTKVAMIEMGDPFQGFIYGQVLFPVTIALKFGIQLIFRGENAEAEYGGSPESWSKKFLPMNEFKKIYFSNYTLDFWLKKGFTKEELSFFYPPLSKEFENKICDSYFYGYFRNWSNHSNFYYASKHTGFKPNVRRTEGTYTKYSSIDDKLDTFHQWFALLKFGHGRCTANAAREIREGYITREEGVALVHKYDTEFPKLYFKEFLEYTNLSEDEFWDIAERWRNHNLWTKKNNEWVKKYPVK
tara:strand:+ start:1529 stop:2677 length:1149 start_codon:yes stop_codon:yes gene_type:complete